MKDRVIHYFRADSQQRIVTHKPHKLCISVIENGVPSVFTVPVKISDSKIKRRTNITTKLDQVWFDSTASDELILLRPSRSAEPCLQLRPDHNIGSSKVGFMLQVETLGGKTQGRKKQKYLHLQRGAQYAVFANNSHTQVNGVILRMRSGETQPLEHWGLDRMVKECWSLDTKDNLDLDDLGDDMNDVSDSQDSSSQEDEESQPARRSYVPQTMFRSSSATTHAERTKDRERKNRHLFYHGAGNNSLPPSPKIIPNMTFPEQPSDGPLRGLDTAPAIWGRFDGNGQVSSNHGPQPFSCRVDPATFSYQEAQKPQDLPSPFALTSIGLDSGSSFPSTQSLINMGTPIPNNTLWHQEGQSDDDSFFGGKPASHHSFAWSAQAALEMSPCTSPSGVGSSSLAIENMDVDMF